MLVGLMFAVKQARDVQKCPFRHYNTDLSAGFVLILALPRRQHCSRKMFGLDFADCGSCGGSCNPESCMGRGESMLSDRVPEECPSASGGHQAGRGEIVLLRKTERTGTTRECKSCTVPDFARTESSH